MMIRKVTKMMKMMMILWDHQEVAWKMISPRIVKKMMQ